jgi:hypothetical protein
MVTSPQVIPDQLRSATAGKSLDKSRVTENMLAGPTGRSHTTLAEAATRDFGRQVQRPLEPPLVITRTSVVVRGLIRISSRIVMEMPADPFGTPEPPYLYPAPQTEISCSRMLNDITPPVCGKPPELHVLWEFHKPEAQSALCTLHSRDLTELDFAQAHPVGPACGVDGAVWDIERNCCALEKETAAETADDRTETPLIIERRLQAAPAREPISGRFG